MGIHTYTMGMNSFGDLVRNHYVLIKGQLQN